MSIGFYGIAGRRRTKLRFARRDHALIVLALLTSPVFAQSPMAGDPCADAPSDSRPSPQSIQSQIRIERDTAVVIAKHLQRACQLIKVLPLDASTTANATASRLRLEVLEPIYREYPDLRGRDLTSNQANGPQSSYRKPDGRPHTERMGPATAVYFRWTLDQAQRSFPNAPILKSCAAHDEKCAQTMVDIVSEIGFAASPIYQAFPGFWHIIEKEGDRIALAQPRSAERDATFRKRVAVPGSVKLTPAALQEVRDAASAMRREDGGQCQVVAITWDLETRWKGPEDADWKKAGPGLSLGAYLCAQVPSDVVQTIDGIPMAIFGETANQFEGKLIDYEDRKFVLRDR